MERSNLLRQLNAARMRHEREFGVQKMYDSPRWSNFKKIMRGFGNAFCQRILDDGTRCRNAGKIWHHLLSPRQRPDLFTDPENLVLSCADCHPPNSGNPTDGYLWVPTLTSADEPPAWYPLPGAIVPPECPIWGGRRIKTGNSLMPCGGTTSVNAARIAAAMPTEGEIAKLLEGL